MIKFFNTLSGRLEAFQPLEKGRVRLYTCGPTVYDAPHIGNYRAYMFEDLLKRFLMFMGFRVQHVMNITDVEDKIILRAKQMGLELDAYTEPYIEAFHTDLETLNILPADSYPRATRYIDSMAAMVKKLVEKGFAYEKDGSYYFDIDRFEAYGRLSKIDMEGRKIGVRIDSDEYEKESVHDFALWKAPKPDEFFWETDIGPGRPGWHIECSVMSMELLGETIDIHCGGIDNIFPHHENEIAQSEAATGRTFVKYWLHCQHLIRDGQKMSKSKGNTVTLKQLIEEHGARPRDIRLMLLSTHYRKMLNFTLDGLAQAQSALDRVRNFQIELKTRRFAPGESLEIENVIQNMRERFIKGLSDDLNISTALTSLFEAIKKSNTLIAADAFLAGDARKMTKALAELDQVLGVMDSSIDVAGFENITPGPESRIAADLEEKMRIREEARISGDFSRADALRDEIRARGFIIEDTKDGPRLKKESRG